MIGTEYTALAAPPSDHIRALVCGYAAEHRANKVLVMLQAFIDDSASDSGDRRLFLAGYVGKADKWVAFSDAWARALIEAPAIEYLKMSEAHSLRGQFAGWSVADRDKKLQALARLIESYDLDSIQCSVSRKEYIEIVRPVAPHGLGNPYFACFFGIIITMARYSVNVNNKLPIDFLFDEQGGLGLEALMFYDYVKSLQLPEIREVLGASPVFRDDKKIVALQAADVLAWHVRREHEGRDGLGAIDFLRRDGRHVIVHFEADMLRSLADEMRSVPGVHLTKTLGDWRRTKAEIARLATLGVHGPIEAPKRGLATLRERAARILKRLTGK